MSEAIPRDAGAIRAVLKGMEFLPSKGLGQNFLAVPEVAKRFVEAVEPVERDHVVEVGPGLGAISEWLAASGASVTLIERDARLARRLSVHFSNAPRVMVVERDALRIDPRDLLGRGPLKIVGNLPYSISTPLLRMFTSPLVPARRLVFGLQEEVADRLAAAPGSKDYGSLTAIVQRGWRVEKLGSIPSDAYVPRPRVESALVRLLPRPASEILPVDAGEYEKLLRLGFSQRRKMLRNLLGVERDRWEALAEEIGFSPEARAEALGVTEWVALTNALRPLPDKRVRPGEELFDVVDAEDRVTGQLPRDEVHARDLRHRAVHILILNNAGELYLQKRVAWKDRNPSLWDSSAAGHVDAGERYEEAALRELEEELNLTADLSEVLRLRPSAETGFEFLKVYVARHSGRIRGAPAEVECGAFFEIRTILRWMESEPEAFTPVFRLCRPVLERLAAAKPPSLGGA